MSNLPVSLPSNQIALVLQIVHLRFFFFFLFYLWIDALLPAPKSSHPLMSFLINLVNDDYSQTFLQRAYRTSKLILPFLSDLGTMLTLTFYMANILF